MTIPELAKKIVDAFHLDFTDRRGLRQTWDGIDRDTRDGIVRWWVELCTRELLAAEGLPGTPLGVGAPWVAATGQKTPEGELLWRVEYASSYYDNDPRGPGNIPVGAVGFVLASSRDEAINKARTLRDFRNAKENKDDAAKETIRTTIASFEELQVGEELASHYPTPMIRRIELGHPDDQRRYRLAVVLLPVEKK